MSQEDDLQASYALETAIEVRKSPKAVEQIASYAARKLNNISESLNPRNYSHGWINLQKKYFGRAVDLIPGVSEARYLSDARAFIERRENAFIERTQRKFLIVGIIALIPALAPLLPFAYVIVGEEN